MARTASGARWSRHPGACAAVVFEGPDHVLLVRQMREAVRRELLEILRGPAMCRVRHRGHHPQGDPRGDGPSGERA